MLICKLLEVLAWEAQSASTISKLSSLRSRSFRILSTVRVFGKGVSGWCVPCVPRYVPSIRTDKEHPKELRHTTPFPTRLFQIKNWAAANGGVTNGGLRGVWPPFPEIGRNRPFSAFSCLFSFFRRVRRAPGKSRKRRKKAFFLRYPQICLNPHLLNPHLRHSTEKLFKS